MKRFLLKAKDKNYFLPNDSRHSRETGDFFRFISFS